jgi:histidinol-phosphate aminotransferase
MALEDIEYMRNYVEEVTSARKVFEQFLMGYTEKVVPFSSIGNFVLMRFQSAEIKEMVLNHLGEHGIFVRNLTHSTKLDNCLRISVGTLDQMRRVMAAFTSLWTQ